MTITTVTLTYADTPPSLNQTGTRGSHWVVGRMKKLWQTNLEILLMEARLPRGLVSVTASASMRFSVRRDRDEGNHRWLLEKALGDALVNGGWLPDDTAGQFRFGQVLFEDERGPRRTTIELAGESR